MISRLHTRCPACDTPTVVRVGVGYAPIQRILVHCPTCDSAIRGRLFADNEYPRVELDNAVLTGAPEDDSDWPTVTTHPEFPIDPDTRNSPFLDAFAVLGDSFEEFGSGAGAFHSLLAEGWHKLEAAYGFYLREDWERYDALMRRLIEENYSNEPSIIERHDVIHRLLSVVLMPLGPGGAFVYSKKEIWERGQPNAALMTFVGLADTKRSLVDYQGRVFDQIRRMIEIRDSWIPALPVIFLNNRGRNVPASWRMPMDDFHLVRDAYRQNFEICCQGLRYLVAIENAAEGRQATQIRVGDSAGAWIPSGLDAKRSPKTLAQFDRKTAETKEKFLDRYPVTQGEWMSVFSRSVRNGIAHADADLDLRRGVVRLRQGEYRYLYLVRDLVAQLQLLMLFVDLAKLLRIYGTATL